MACPSKTTNKDGDEKMRANIADYNAVVEAVSDFTPRLQFK